MMLRVMRNYNRIQETKIWYLKSKQNALLKFNKIYCKITKTIIYKKQWKIFIQSKKEMKMANTL